MKLELPATIPKFFVELQSSCSNRKPELRPAFEEILDNLNSDEANAWAVRFTLETWRKIVQEWSNGIGIVKEQGEHGVERIRSFLDYFCC